MSEEISKIREIDLVKRSSVPEGLKYRKYVNYLRYDFFYSCGYCTMSESEASAIRFTIDHYNPQSTHPDQKHIYYNLIYSCNQCNILKGDRVVPEDAKLDGIHFFRPDEDNFSENFQISGVRIKGLSPCGEYTIEALDLNRQHLRKLRDLRSRVHNCRKMVAEGIRGLRNVRLDRLPPRIRQSAKATINQVAEYGDAKADAIDALLRENAKSPILGDGEGDDQAHQKDRKHRLKGIEALYPGTWRA